MNEKKTVKFIIIGLILALFVIGTATYALYQSTPRGKAMGAIANWNFKVNDATSTFKINMLTNAKNTVEGMLAPGSYGSFDIRLDASKTDCDVNYLVEFSNVVGRPKNLKFYLDEEYTDELILEEETLTGVIDYGKNMVKVITIYWNWEYGTGTDNQNITSGEMTFDVNITGSQVEFNS